MHVRWSLFSTSVFACVLPMLALTACGSSAASSSDDVTGNPTRDSLEEALRSPRLRYELYQKPFAVVYDNAPLDDDSKVFPEVLFHQSFLGRSVPVGDDVELTYGQRDFSARPFNLLWRTGVPPLKDCKFPASDGQGDYITPIFARDFLSRHMGASSLRPKPYSVGDKNFAQDVEYSAEYKLVLGKERLVVYLGRPTKTGSKWTIVAVDFHEYAYHGGLLSPCRDVFPG